MAALLLSLLPFLLLLLPVQTSARAEFWNIDCGASTKYSSPDNLTWVGDSEYVRTGESHQILNLDDTNHVRLKTLRSFPRGAKNCYSLPVGEKRKVHVTVDFFYGNYDGLANPPSFQVIFDSHSICTVTTSMETRFYYYCSWTYETRSSNTSICFGRMHDDQVPFVSALQVVDLDDGMYPELNSSSVLFDKRRVAFGANNTLRYPDDAYNRVWFLPGPLTEGYNYSTIVSNATDVDTSSCTGNPPRKLFERAASPFGGDPTANLTIGTLSLPSSYVSVYFIMYFSEVSNLTGTKHRRSFLIYVDGNPITSSSATVEPPFGAALEVSAVVPASTSTRIDLIPTPNSTLPPIISGLEMLKMDSIQSNGTYSADVKGLSVLQNRFEILENWTGDPCRPTGYNWEWVTCTADEPPRVTTLSLSGYSLSGRLPDFSGLDALEKIDLHNNSLYGSIPDFLGELPSLRELNLADNNFSYIPPSLLEKRIRLNTTGNPLLDRPSENGTQVPALPPPPSRSEKIETPIFISCLLFLMCMIVA